MKKLARQMTIPKNRNWPVLVWMRIGHFQWDDPGSAAHRRSPDRWAIYGCAWRRGSAAPAFGGRQFRRFGAGRMGSRDGLHAAGSIAVLHRLSEDCGSVRFVRRRQSAELREPERVQEPRRSGHGDVVDVGWTQALFSYRGVAGR